MFNLYEPNLKQWFALHDDHMPNTCYSFASKTSIYIKDRCSTIPTITSRLRVADATMAQLRRQFQNQIAIIHDM